MLNYFGRKFHVDYAATVILRKMNGGLIKEYFRQIDITSVKTKLIMSKDFDLPFEQELADWFGKAFLFQKTGINIWLLLGTFSGSIIWNSSLTFDTLPNIFIIITYLFN